MTKKTAKKIAKPNPQDATLRNIRKSRHDIAKLTSALAALDQRVYWLERRVAGLEPPR